jgi:hypothetical protein
VPPTTLVVDFGAFSTGAAIMVGEQATLVRDPLSGAALWPSQLSVEGSSFYAGSAAERMRLASPRFAIDGPRRALESDQSMPLGERDITPATALSAYLGSLRAEAGRIMPAPLDRLTLTVPTTYQLGDKRRDLLIAAGEAAGFAEVELIGSATAVLLDTQTAYQFPDGSLVLVCDLGETWSTVLLRVHQGEGLPLAHDTATSGRDLDALLLDDLKVQAREWLTQRLALPGDDGLRVRHQAMDFVRQIKHALSQMDEQAEITGRLSPDAPGYRLTREWLDRLAEPGLRWVGASCRSLVARAASGWGGANFGAAPGAPAEGLADVQAVVLAGGHARLGRAERVLLEELGRPVIRLDEPELAPMRGAVRFAAMAGTRRILADHPRWRVEPLVWDVPTGRARLERWSVAPDDGFRRGDVLAHVRTMDERVYELTAPGDGVLLASRGRAGDVVGPTLTASAKRAASLFAGDGPGKRRELAGAGEWFFIPDRRALVECAATGDLVRVWSVPDGAVLHEFRPGLDPAVPSQGRLFVSPTGVLALVTWDRSGGFSVWDVRSGAQLAAFRESGVPTSVLVHEGEWRLAAEGEDSGSTGRYRRTVLTIWDLTSGKRLERLTDGKGRLVGFEPRSVYDSLTDAALSPDGRLRAVQLATGFSLRAAGSEQELFRTDYPPGALVRVAFSADGQFLLASREAPQYSVAEVWEL